jgi:hypothetical protein
MLEHRAIGEEASSTSLIFLLPPDRHSASDRLQLTDECGGIKMVLARRRSAERPQERPFALTNGRLVQDGAVQIAVREISITARMQTPGHRLQAPRPSVGLRCE